METKFEIGELQKKWIALLRQFPERQLTGRLGVIEEGSIKVCCLGQAELMLCELSEQKPKLNKDNELLSNKNPFRFQRYKKLGLRNSIGSIIKRKTIGTRYKSLAEMNDGGTSWTDIANFIETFPQFVFKFSI